MAVEAQNGYVLNLRSIKQIVRLIDGNLDPVIWKILEVNRVIEAAPVYHEVLSRNTNGIVQ